MAVRTAMPRFWPSSEMKCVVGVRVTSERPSTNMKAVTCSGTSGRSTLGVGTSAAATSGAACVLDAATLLILVECAGRACPSPAESRLGENARAASSKSMTDARGRRRLTKSRESSQTCRSPRDAMERNQARGGLTRDWAPRTPPFRAGGDAHAGQHATCALGSLFLILYATITPQCHSMLLHPLRINLDDQALEQPLHVEPAAPGVAKPHRAAHAGVRRAAQAPRCCTLSRSSLQPPRGLHARRQRARAATKAHGL